MDRFRSSPPKKLGGLEIVAVRDYLSGMRRRVDGTEEDFSGPEGNVLVFETSEAGNYIAARPSGTEPKIKFYMFTYASPESIQDLEATKQSLQQRLDGFSQGMQDFADQ